MRGAAAIILSIAIAACSAEYGKGFRSTDAEYMRLFVAQLQRDGISYKESDDGAVLYRSSDENAVKLVHDQVKRRLSLAISVKYEEVEAREYLSSLLKAKGLSYTEEGKEDGVWIKWYPESKKQQKDVEMEVVQYILSLKAGAK